MLKSFEVGFIETKGTEILELLKNKGGFFGNKNSVFQQKRNLEDKLKALFEQCYELMHS